MSVMNTYPIFDNSEGTPVNQLITDLWGISLPDSSEIETFKSIYEQLPQDEEIDILADNTGTLAIETNNGQDTNQWTVLTAKEVDDTQPIFILHALNNDTEALYTWLITSTDMPNISNMTFPTPKHYPSITVMTVTTQSLTGEIRTAENRIILIPEDQSILSSVTKMTGNEHISQLEKLRIKKAIKEKGIYTRHGKDGVETTYEGKGEISVLQHRYTRYTTERSTIGKI